MSVFHAYDVRGLSPEQITPELARGIGNALATRLGPGEVGIGWDMRPTSPALVDALCQGLTEGGRDVVKLGMLTTPAVYFAIGHLNLAGGVIVTASHNPAEYNGFKICREQAIPIGGDSGLKAIEAACEAGELHKADKPGAVREQPILSDFLDHILGQLRTPIGEMKVAIDSGNGVAGPTLNALLERLPGVKATKLFFEPDGTFPNHEANPLKIETLDTLRKTVVDEGLDLGIAFDGDGDRAGFVDETGAVVESDLLTAFIAQDILAEEKGASIVYDLRSSLVVKETIEALGGTAIETRVGHAFIKKTMRERGVVFGGELSGHYYWRDNSYADSALMAVTRVLSICTREGKPLSELIKPLRRTARSGEINFRVEDKDGKIAELKSTYAEGEQSELDGITVRFDDWWFNVRKSNTEPVLRLNLEARTPERLAEKLAELEALLGSRA